LDSVHRAIESRPLCFALTGSSSRKLKRGGANLLAGRAFVYHLYSLTHLEIGDAFNLEEALHFGTLPKILGMKTHEEKSEFLRAYALTYIKEEIVAEQMVRKLQPFRDFLEIAAQCNGQIVNFSRIAEEVGADVKTIQSYFEILEDTLVGFLLAPFHESIRKRQRQNPKFYFFDTGVKRALDRTLTQSFGPGTYAYGNAFEHFIILEIHRLNSYWRKDWRFSYLRTKDDAEIDLIIDRPGLPRALIEIKSKDRITETDVTHLNRFASDMQKTEAFCLSRDAIKKRIGLTLCLPWQEGLKELFA
jgi:predicted AAA+ superfamily ATPase